MEYKVSREILAFLTVDIEFVSFYLRKVLYVRIMPIK
jgi:hypothetical protein